MRRIVFAIMTVALSVVPALAQPAPWQPERLTAGWTFTPGFVFGAMWDTNVAVQNQGNPQIHGGSALINPRGELDFNGPRTHFNTGYSGAFEQYRTLNALNRFDQRARLDFEQRHSERLQVNATASYTSMPTTDRLEVGGSLPFVDIGSEVFDAGGGVKLALSRRTSLEGEYRFEDIVFDRSQTSINPFQFLFSGHSQSPAARLMHQLTDRLTVGAAFQYQHADIGAGSQTIDIENSTGEATYKLSSTTTLSGGGGLSYLRVSQATLATTGLATTGPSFHGGIEHHAGQLLLSASYQRTFVPAFGLGGLTANQYVSGNAYLPFAQGRYYVSGGVSYSRTSPVQALGVGYRLDSTWTDAAAGYQVARWLRAEGFLAVTHQNSTARGLIDRTRVGIQLVTFKPVRIE